MKSLFSLANKIPTFECAFRFFFSSEQGDGVHEWIDNEGGLGEQHCGGI